MQAATSAPLIERSIERATGIVYNITGGSDLTLQEVNQCASVVLISLLHTLVLAVVHLSASCMYTSTQRQMLASVCLHLTGHLNLHHEGLHRTLAVEPV